MPPFLKRWYHRIRIYILKLRGRARTYEVKLPDGRTERATVEQKQEKLCPHTRLEQVAPLLWQCTMCAEAYFFIMYKVHATGMDVVTMMEDMAKHFRSTIRDLPDEPPAPGTPPATA